MILYHGSFKEIETPHLSFSRDSTDFGKGFYTTPLKHQAEKWTRRFKRRYGYGVVSAYEVDEEELLKNVSTLRFDTYSLEWLDFVAGSRIGNISGAFCFRLLHPLHPSWCRYIVLHPESLR